MARMYDTVKQAFQDIIAPQIEGLKGEITALRTEIRRLDEKIDGVRGELALTRQHLDDKIGALGQRLDDVLEIRERLAALEAAQRAS